MTRMTSSQDPSTEIVNCESPWGGRVEGIMIGDYWGDGRHAPSVVPALCIVYWTLLFLRRRCTAATSLETEAEGVPMGMRQKSDIGFDSVSIRCQAYTGTRLIDGVPSFLLFLFLR